MADSFTEVTTESWFSRLGNSIKSVLIGVVLFLVSFPLLWWNEGRAVHTIGALVELENNVVQGTADKVEPQNNNKPIHVSGKATTDDTLTDDDFDVSVQAIKLERIVEMYQWEEEKKTESKKNVGGSKTTKTTYSYHKRWTDKVIDSNSFNQKGQADHQNPGSMRIASSTVNAATVMLGAFKMSPGLVSQMTNYESVPITDAELAAIKKKQGESVALNDNKVYMPNAEGGGVPNPASPQIGDLRVSFRVIKPAEVSVLAEQTGDTFQAWQSKKFRGPGTAIENLRMGRMSSAEMVAKLKSEANMLTWILRAAGFLLMAFGIGMVFSPLAVLADVLPFLGDLLRMGIGLFAGLVAAALSLVTIALAWLAYRPVLGIGLLVVALALIIALKVLGKARKPAATANAM